MSLRDFLLANRQRQKVLAKQAIAGSSFKGQLLAPSAFRQLDKLDITASRFLHGNLIGNRSSFRRRPASDFIEHRKYVPGDDPRHIDWKASARHEQIFTRQGEQPKETTVSLLVDCSASMAWGTPAKNIAALSLGAALGYLALSNNDRLVVLPLGDSEAASFGPVTGKGQFPSLLRFLRGVTFQGGLNLADDFRMLQNSFKEGCLLILISDLLGEDRLLEALSLTPVPTWDPIVLHLLHPRELDPPRAGRVELVDAETGIARNCDIDNNAIEQYEANFMGWMERLELDCIENHAFYTVIMSDWDLEDETLPHLRRVNLLASS